MKKIHSKLEGSLLKILLLSVFLGAGALGDAENPCDGPGVFPYPGDTTKLVICSQYGEESMVTKVAECPEDFIFSEEERTCVPKNVNSHIRVSRATSDICKASGPVCASCDLMVVCVNMNSNFLPLVNVSCSDTSSDNVCDDKIKGCRPPSVNSTCRAAAGVTAFRCLQPGFFPDPTDCKKYHICDDSLVHYEDWCDGPFDAVKGACQDNVTCSDVADFTCSANLLPKAIRWSPGYYAICIPDISRSSQGNTKLNYQMAIMQCPPNKKYNEATSSCELACSTRPSRLMEPEDCHVYYDCPVSSDASAAPVRKVCPSGLAYDGVRKMCYPESKVSACRPHAITTRDVNQSQTASTNATAVTGMTATPTIPTRETVANGNNTSASYSSTQSTPVVYNNSTGQSTTTSQQMTSTTTTPMVITTPKCTDRETFPDTSTCRRYFQCFQGSLVRRQCPWFTYYNARRRHCSVGFWC